MNKKQIRQNKKNKPNAQNRGTLSAEKINLKKKKIPNNKIHIALNNKER